MNQSMAKRGRESRILAIVRRIGETMDDPRDFKQFLRELSPPELDRFHAARGGEWKTAEHIIDEIRTPDQEQSLCMAINKLYGVEIFTGRQGAERAQISAAEAARQSAEHARGANAISAEANRIATAANQISQDANRISAEAIAIARAANRTARWNTIWTFGAFGVALVTLLISGMALWFGIAK